MTGCTTDTTHLIEDFLEVGSAHTVGQVSVCRMGEKELPLSSHSCIDVLPAIYVLLAPVHHTDVTWTQQTRVSLTFTIQSETL